MELETEREARHSAPESRLATALAAGALVFGAFATYAFVAPATYRSQAVVSILAIDGAANVRLPPLQAARRLREAVLDRETAQRLATEQVPAGADPVERTATARRVESSVEIDSLDARSFTISCSDAYATRVQRVCAELATRAVKLGPLALAPEPTTPRGPDPGAQQRADELMARLEAHPKLASEARSRETFGADPGISALHAERNRIQAVLATEAEVRAAESSDNPYDAGTVRVDTTQLKRRLVEIDRTLAARRPSHSRQPLATSAPSPSQRAEMQPTTGVQKSDVALPRARPPELQARLIASAALPSSPIDPNRPRLLLIGAALAIVVSVLVARVRRVSKLTSASSETSEPVRADPSMPDSHAATLASPGDSMQPPEAFSTTERVPTSRPPSTPRMGSEPPKRPSSSAPRRAAIEINAPSARHIDPRIEAEAKDGDGENAKATMGRTQALGSPMPSLSRRSSAPKLAIVAEQGSQPEPKKIISNSEIVVGNVARPASASAALNIVSLASTWLPDATLSAERRLALRDELYALSGDRRFVVAVTGASGTSIEKSRVAAELALCLSQPVGSRILLLEANFQRPSVHRLMGVEMPRLSGFSEQLQAGELEGSGRPWTVMECSRSLHVLAEGLMRVPELIVSRKFQHCIEQLRGHYNFVVIDAPLLSEPSACRAVDAVVDGAIVVHTEAKNLDLERASASFPGKCISSVSAAG